MQRANSAEKRRKKSIDRCQTSQKPETASTSVQASPTIPMTVSSLCPRIFRPDTSKPFQLPTSPQIPRFSATRRVLSSGSYPLYTCPELRSSRCEKMSNVEGKVLNGDDWKFTPWGRVSSDALYRRLFQAFAVMSNSYDTHRASLSDSKRAKMSSTLTGPLTFRTMDRELSSMNSTRTWVIPPRDPVRPRTCRCRECE